MEDIEWLRADLIDYLGTGMQYNSALQIDLDKAMYGTDEEVIELALDYGFIEKDDEKNEGRTF
jgi:hypothetical protein